MLAGFIGKILTGGLFDTIKELGRAYINKEISEEEYHSRVADSLLKAGTDVSKAMFESGADTFKEFNHSLRTVKAVQWCYVATVAATLWSLFWYTYLQPLGVAMAGCDPNSKQIFVECSFPVLKTGDTLLEWNYFLLAGLFGLAPFVLRDQSKGIFDAGMDWIKKRFRD